MVGNERSGNPNIKNEPKPGPTSNIGKIKCSMNSFKNRKSARLGDSKLKTMMEEAGVDFSKAEEAIEKVNIFKSFMDSKSTEELNEIKKLEGILQILNTDMASRTMKKLEKGIPLDGSDIKLIRLLKETLEASYKLKYGEKKVNIHASYNDIRQMMFGDEK